MRRNGFEVEPTYDSKGVCRGYSVGEKLYDLDGNYSSTVMYKASAKGFCHGRDLTVSKLFDTWQKLHPEKEETRTESYRWQQNRQEEAIPQKPSRSSLSDDDDAYLGLLRIKEAAERKNTEKPAVPTPVKQTEPSPRKSTEAESDRRTAIWLALNAIKRFVKSPFRTEFFAEQSDQSPGRLSSPWLLHRQVITRCLTLCEVIRRKRKTEVKRLPFLFYFSPYICSQKTCIFRDFFVSLQL